MTQSFAHHVYISSNKSINLEAEQLYIDSTDIRLGSKIANQAVLKGDDTVELLKNNNHKIYREFFQISKKFVIFKIFHRFM